MEHFGRKIAIITILLYLLLFPVSAAVNLIPGGQVVGMQLNDNTVSVAAIDENLGAAAKAAGLKTGDRLLSVDGIPIRCPGDVRTALSKCGQTVTLSVCRDNKEKTLRFTPASTENGPRLGVYLKQGTAGIGTVTYYDPADGTFGALGHGVNTVSGNPVLMESGSIYEATVLSVRKGKTGTPGQLMGTVTDPDPMGKLDKNTAQGVFGHTVPPDSQALPTGQAKTGRAVIRSTVDQGPVREYSVEILKIYANTSAEGRNMLLKITDPALLKATGGIVQGMSGSPIIQDGKLVGAVTHVLVNDPTMGYGIFIENMLNAAA